MYFFHNQGRQYLDLTGNLILSYNSELVKYRVSSAGPKKVLRGKYILISNLSFKKRVKATLAAIKFIWGPSTELKNGLRVIK